MNGAVPSEAAGSPGVRARMLAITWRCSITWTCRCKISDTAHTRCPRRSRPTRRDASGIRSAGCLRFRWRIGPLFAAGDPYRVATGWSRRRHRQHQALRSEQAWMPTVVGMTGCRPGGTFLPRPGLNPRPASHGTFTSPRIRLNCQRDDWHQTTGNATTGNATAGNATTGNATSPTRPPPSTHTDKEGNRDG